MDNETNGRLHEFLAAEGKKLKGYVQRRFRNLGDMDAEDIVGEVMLSVMVRADTSLPADHLAAYIYRALRNKAIDYRRRNARILSLQSLMDEDGGIPAFLTPGAVSVSGEAERREFMRRLSAAIDALEPRQRAVFIATELHGKSFRELSEQWNEPMGTLLSRKSRAVKALRQMLQDYKF